MRDLRAKWIAKFLVLLRSGAGIAEEYDVRLRMVAKEADGFTVRRIFEAWDLSRGPCR
jgi:hypothetical protein